MIRVDIVSDAICPWCFIGKRRFERALAQLPPGSVQVGWRPFQLNPDMPREGMDREEYLRLKFGDGGGGRMYDAVKQAGAEEGIPFAFELMKRTPNTIDAHRLIRFADGQGRQDQLVEAMFTAYFTQGADIGDRAVLAEIAATAGLEGAPAFLAGDAEEATVRQEDEFARSVGIHGVPCFILERKFAVSGAQAPETFLKAFEELGLAAPAAT